MMSSRREVLQGALAAAIASVAPGCAPRGQSAAPPHPLSNLIPAPLQISTRNGELRLRSEIALECADPSLVRTLERFRNAVVRRTGLKLAATRHVAKAASSEGLFIRVELAHDSDLDLLPAPLGVSPAGDLIADERHSLTISSDGIVVRGIESAGVTRGLTSLLQLLSTVAPAADGAIVLPAARILDAPRFAWRGLTLDVARTLHGAGEVRRIVDLMALYKLNVLDLPFSRDLYSDTEWRQLAGYALERAVIVVPGIADWKSTAERLSELVAILPGPFVRIGGGPEVEGMPRNAPTSDLEHLSAYVHSLGRRTVGWQDSKGDIAATDLVQYWNPSARLYSAAVEEGGDSPLLPGLSPATAEPLPDAVESAKHRVAPGIVSPLEHCFLDVPYAERSVVASQESLRRRLGERRYAPRTVAEAFDWEPLQSLGPANENALAGVSGVIGARSARSFDEITFLLLPRLAGIADKAWSAPREHAWNEHRKSLAAHRRLWAHDRLAFFQTSTVDWE